MCAEPILRPRKRRMSEESEPQEPATPAALFPGFAHSLSQPAGTGAPPELVEPAAAAAPPPAPAPAPSPTPAPTQYLLVADDVARRKKRKLGIAYETPLHRAARYGFSV